MKNIHTKPKLTFLLVTGLTLLAFSCKESITEPEPPAGRRDYVWTADTIKVPFTSFDKIWGDAHDNVWIVGPGGGLDKTIWHFNGTKWSTDGISRNISPRAIWGFGKNDVWIAGYDGKIWHYDGVWKESLWVKKPDWSITFSQVFGTSRTNLFATGTANGDTFRKGIIMKWNGDSWKEIDIPTFTTYNFVIMRKGIEDKSNYFLVGSGVGTSGDYLLAIFEFDEINIKKIYEAPFVNETWTFITLAGKKLLFVIGNKICRYANGQFVSIFNVNTEKFNQGIWGRSENDVFVSMKDGIMHFNGTDLQYIYQYKGNEHAFGATVLENEVFVLTNDYKNGYTIILRGELR